MEENKNLLPPGVGEQTDLEDLIYENQSQVASQR